MKNYVIHLEDRIDRFQHLKGELDSLWRGEWEIWPAIKHKIGAIGLSQTYRQIFQSVLEGNDSSVLTFEDDVKFSSLKSREWFEECIKELPSDWDILLGGVYIWKNPENFGEKLMKCNDFSGTHMVMWSRRACEVMLKHRPEDGITPRDIDRYVKETDLNVFVCNPMVAFQIESYSDIFNGSRSLESFLEDKIFV